MQQHFLGFLPHHTSKYAYNDFMIGEKVTSRRTGKIGEVIGHHKPSHRVIVKYADGTSFKEYVSVLIKNDEKTS